MISEQTKEYYQLGKKNDVRESAKRLRRQFLRYKDAEIVYSMVLRRRASKKRQMYTSKTWSVILMGYTSTGNLSNMETFYLATRSLYLSYIKITMIALQIWLRSPTLVIL